MEECGELSTLLCGSRTHWHDLLGKHCPKFALDHTVIGGGVYSCAECGRSTAPESAR
jgi:hypothetical protein